MPSGKKYEQVVRALAGRDERGTSRPSGVIVKIWSHAYGGARRLEDQRLPSKRPVRLGVLAAERELADVREVLLALVRERGESSFERIGRRTVGRERGETSDDGADQAQGTFGGSACFALNISER